MPDVLKQIEFLKLIPVVAIKDAADAAPLADALVAGGLPIAEITFRTPAAADAIRNMAKRPDILIGAGTVLTVDQAQRAVDSGAHFIVSPGTDRAVVQWCLKHSITVTPGVATPTDIQLAMSLGVTVLKFFPAEAFGGLAALKAIAAPFHTIRFIPTGGISPDNLAAYLAFDHVLACGGSWMVKTDLIAAGRFEQITQLTRQAVEIARTARP